MKPWDQARTREAAKCACGHFVRLHNRDSGECRAIVRYSNGQRCQCRSPR